MPEFVVVTFAARRSVFMDNQPMGHTGDLLTIQAGFHDFDLGSPADYMPATQNVNVVNTTSANPGIVPFAPMMAVAEEVPPPRAKRRAKAAKKKAAKKSSRTQTAKKAKRIAPKKKAAKKIAKKKIAKKK